jgi:hypothetical protein
MEYMYNRLINAKITISTSYSIDLAELMVKMINRKESERISWHDLY